MFGRNDVRRAGGVVVGMVFALALVVGVSMTGSETVSPAAAAVPVGVATMLAQNAPAEIAERGWSTSIECPAIHHWNPDAGTGLVRCATGYTALNVETEETNPAYFAWREDGVGGKTTKANYKTRGLKRCVGCDKGGVYVAGVARGHRDLFCISGNDAGVTMAVECGK